MRFKSDRFTIPCLAVNIFALLAVSVGVISNRVTSDTALTKRLKGLEIVSDHVQSKTCWKLSGTDPLKIGDIIEPAGSELGKIPTSCVYSKKSKQFLHVGYLDQELQVLHIYSIKEVQSQISKNNTQKGGD
jgi:hypothetical protein